jgi:hypothetical protein
VTARQTLLLVAGFGWWPIACAVLAGACALAWWRRGDRTAWTGLAALGAAAIAVTALRAIVMHAAEPFAAIGLLWPSGHAALAAVVYGTIGFVYGRHLPSGARSVVRVLCCLLMVAVPSAMVGLGFHTVPDVLVGGAAGLVALVASRRLAPAGSSRVGPATI